MTWLRGLRRFLGWRFYSHSPFLTQTSNFLKSYQLVQIFYFFMLYFALDRNWMYTRIADSPSLDLLWPVLWIQYFHPVTGAKALYLCLLGSVLLSAWQPWRRSFRILTAISMFLFVALFDSLGKVADEFQCLIWISFVLVFLPNRSRAGVLKSRRQRQIYLFVVWSAQTMFLFFYSLSGFWKLRHTVFAEHSWHLLGAEASYYVLYEYFRTGTKSMLFDLALNQSWIFTLALPLVIGMQLSSLFIAFRPSRHRFWGLAIVLFHGSTYLLQEVLFPANVFIAALLLMGSPFTGLPSTRTKSLADGDGPRCKLP